VRGHLTSRATVGALAAALAVAMSGCALEHHGRLERLGRGDCKRGDPLAGVYLPFRLHVKKACVTVSGVVDCVRHEPDGDVHIELRVARKSRRFLQPANAFQRCPGRGKGQRGPHLVVEIIPQQGQLPFLDNSANQGGFVTPRAPDRGDQVTVTGPWVIDTNALHDFIYAGKNVANWAEIHPAWNITIRHRARR
jgi:hypothetical protein